MYYSVSSVVQYGRSAPLSYRGCIKNISLCKVTVKMRCLWKCSIRDLVNSAQSMNNTLRSISPGTLFLYCFASVGFRLQCG